MRYIVLFFLAVSPLAAQSALTGFKAVIKTTVYEDESVSRAIELSYSADEKDVAMHKREFFQSHGYHVMERTEDENFFLTATKIIPPGERSDDPFSRVQLTRRENQFSYAEEFFSRFVMQEIENSDLKNDLATAKVLLAGVEFQFTVIMPGKITETNAGQFHLDSASWHYDIEQIFARPAFQMNVGSVVERNDHALWALLSVALALLLIALLIKLKSRLRHTSID